MPYTVTIEAYRLSPRVDTTDRVPVYSSTHRTPRAAARRLAAIIHGESALARPVRGAIPRDYAGMFMAEGESLTRFRARHSVTPQAGEG